MGDHPISWDMRIADLQKHAKHANCQDNCQKAGKVIENSQIRCKTWQNLPQIFPIKSAYVQQ